MSPFQSRFTKHLILWYNFCMVQERISTILHTEVSGGQAGEAHHEALEGLSKVRGIKRNHPEAVGTLGDKIEVVAPPIQESAKLVLENAAKDGGSFKLGGRSIEEVTSSLLGRMNGQTEVDPASEIAELAELPTRPLT